MSVKKQHMVKIKFSGRNLADLDFFTKSDPFLVLSRPSRIGDGYNQVRKTETVMNNLNPDWKVLYIPLSELCDNNFNLKLKIEVHDEDSKKKSEEIGRCELSLQEMVNLASSGAQTHLKLKMKVRGALLVKECKVENPTDPPQSNRISQDSLFSRHGSIAGYPDSRSGSIVGYPDSRVGSMAGYPDSRAGSIAGYPDTRSGYMVGYPDSRAGSMAGYPDSRAGSMADYPGSRPVTMSRYSDDSISGYPLPASLQLHGYQEPGGYPINQSNPGYFRPEYPPHEKDNGYRQSQASIGFPSSQPPGYSSSQPPGYPLSQPPGYPPSRPPGFPSSQPSSQPPGYSPSQPSGFPPSQPSSYPPSQSSGNPSQSAPGYPSSTQSFQGGSIYPSLDQIPDDRSSYLKNNPGHPHPF